MPIEDALSEGEDMDRLRGAPKIRLYADVCTEQFAVFLEFKLGLVDVSAQNIAIKEALKSPNKAQSGVGEVIARRIKPHKEIFRGEKFLRDFPKFARIIITPAFVSVFVRPDVILQAFLQ